MEGIASHAAIADREGGPLPGRPAGDRDAHARRRSRSTRARPVSATSPRSARISCGRPTSASGSPRSSAIRRAVFGMPEEELIGRTAWEFAKADVKAPEWKQHVLDHETRQSFRNFEYQIADRNGATRWISTNGRPYFDEHGTFLGFRGASMNIAGRKHAEAKLASSARQQQAAAVLSQLALARRAARGPLSGRSRPRRPHARSRAGRHSRAFRRQARAAAPRRQRLAGAIGQHPRRAGRLLPAACARHQLGRAGAFLAAQFQPDPRAAERQGLGRCASDRREGAADRRHRRLLRRVPRIQRDRHQLPAGGLVRARGRCRAAQVGGDAAAQGPRAGGDRRRHHDHRRGGVRQRRSPTSTRPSSGSPATRRKKPSAATRASCRAPTPTQNLVADDPQRGGTRNACSAAPS